MGMSIWIEEILDTLNEDGDPNRNELLQVTGYDYSYWFMHYEDIANCEDTPITIDFIKSIKTDCEDAIKQNKPIRSIACDQLKSLHAKLEDLEAKWNTLQGEIVLHAWW